MLIVLLAAFITITLTLRTKTGRRFITGQLLDPNLDQFNRSTFFTDDQYSATHVLTIKIAKLDRYAAAAFNPQSEQ